MKKITRVLLLIGFLISINCKKGDDGVQTPDSNVDIDQNEDLPDENVPSPEPVSLIFPLDRTECNDGIIIDEQWSSVEFKWNPSDNTDGYEVRLTTTSNFNEIIKETQDTTLLINIQRGKQYKWYVISKSNSTNKTSSSDLWSFYNTGLGVENHAPFPALLTFPTDGQVLTTNDAYYFLWSATDLDNDPLEYELFIGSHPDSLSFKETLSEPKTFMWNYAEREIWQYWKIHTTDPQGSTSISETKSFIRRD